MPLDLVMGLQMSQQERVSSDEFVSQMSDAYELAREHLHVAAERRKQTYDIRVRKSDVHVAIGFGIGTLAHFPANL